MRTPFRPMSITITPWGRFWTSKLIEPSNFLRSQRIHAVVVAPGATVTSAGAADLDADSSALPPAPVGCSPTYSGDSAGSASTFGGALTGFVTGLPPIVAVAVTFTFDQ